MASVTKRPTSQFWFGVYRDRNHRQVRRSTKLTDKSAARRLAEEWERIEELAREGPAAAAQFQKVINEVTREVMGASIPDQSIRSYLLDWVQGGKRRRADSSTERYAGIVRCFLEILGPEADRSLRLIAPFHIERFVNHRLDQGRAPKTISVDTRILGIAFHRAERYGYIDKNPVPVIQLPKVVSTEREPFTYAEIEQLVAAASNLDWQTVILLGAYTGARLGDCVAATWEQVDAEHDLISLRQTKTGKPVILPIHPRLGRHLAHVAEQHATGPLAPSLASKTPGGKHGLSEGFKRIARRAGVDLRIVQGKGRQQFAKRTFHSLRHTFVSALANADVPMEVSMAATGHVSADIHKRYWHLQQERLRRAIWKLADADPNRPA